MIKIVLGILILILAWYGNRQYQHKKFIEEALNSEYVSQSYVKPTEDIIVQKSPEVIVPKKRAPLTVKKVSMTPKYRCDGRQHCSQMGSYEEAKFFLRNCPNTKMDGDGDGIPCERQFGRYD